MFLELILGLILEHEDLNRFPCVTAFQNKASTTHTAILLWNRSIFAATFAANSKWWELLCMRETILACEDLGEAS